MVILWVGMCLGKMFAEDAPTRVIEKPAVIKTVTKVETVTKSKAFVPDSCREVIKQAEIISRASQRTSVATMKQLNLLGDAKVESFTNPELSTLQERQIEIRSSILSDTLKLSKAHGAYMSARAECEGELK